MSNVPHSPLCMCQECQDEALASELSKDAETLRRVSAERDALRARIDAAPTAKVSGDDNGIHFTTGRPADLLPIRGKRVALVKLEDESAA